MNDSQKYMANMSAEHQGGFTDAQIDKIREQAGHEDRMKAQAAVEKEIQDSA